MTDLITQLEQLHEKQLPLVLFNVHFTQSQTRQPIEEIFAAYDEYRATQRCAEPENECNEKNDCTI